MLKNSTVVSNKNRDIKWHFIDANNKVLGRISTTIAKLLIGKNKAIYTPNQNFGDKVVVTNVSKLIYTGKKLKDKRYYRHSQYPKGLKSETLEELIERRPTEALIRSVKGMLPKNRLRQERINNLYVYENDTHPHKAQEK